MDPTQPLPPWDTISILVLSLAFVARGLLKLLE